MAEHTTHPSASQLGDAPLSRTPTGGPVSIEQSLRRHEGLIHAIIRREGSGSLTYQEALQVGRIGLWRAILGYDPARGVAFSTYAWVAIAPHPSCRQPGRRRHGLPADASLTPPGS